MKTFFIISLLTVSVLSNAQVSNSKDCQTLDKYDLEFIEGILKNPTRGEKCNDNRFPVKILIQHESGDKAPFEIQNVYYSDLKNKLSISKTSKQNLLKIDGKIVSASKVVIIQPACREGWDEAVKGYASLKALGECTDNSLKLASGWKTEDEMISKMEMINSPLYNKAVKKCFDQLTKSALDQVKSYLSKNKASIVSITPVKGILQRGYPETGMEFLNFEIQAKSSSNKVSSLILSIPTANKSNLNYLKRTDALGEPIEASERPTEVSIEFGNINGPWVKSSGDTEAYNKNTALLYNSSTMTDLLKIDISNNECREVAKFNIEDEIAETSIDNSSRGNSKSDIENSSSSKSSSSSQSNKQ